MEPITVFRLLTVITQLIDVTSKVINYFNGGEGCPEKPSKACAGGYKSPSTLYRLELSGGRERFYGFMVYWPTISGRRRRAFDRIQKCDGRYS